MLCEIGFACFVTVMGRCLRDIGVLFAGAGCSTLSAVLVANLAHVVSLFAIAAVCGLKGVALFGPRSSVVSTSLFVLGYLGVVFFWASQYEASPFVLPFQMCFGLAGAVGMIGWVSAFFHEGERAVVEILSASFLACILGFALGAIDDVPTVCLLCVLISVMSSACAVGLGSPRLSPMQDNEITCVPIAGVGQFRRIVPVVWAPSLCIGVLGLMSAIARSMLGEQDAAYMLSITMASEAVSCFVLIFLFIWGTLRAEIVSLYKVLFPVGALAFFSLTFLGDRFIVVLAAVAEFSFSLCSVLVTLQVIDFCNRLESPPTVVMGLFSGFSHAVLTLGYLLLPLGNGAGNDNFYSIVAVVVIFALAMALFLVTRLPSDSVCGTVTKPACEPPGKNGCVVAPSVPVLPESLRTIALSVREGEVLSLILEGRDVPSMADALGLSKNTVRTHVKSLYAKFDVHSRQELIDLFHE